ncbi:MAG: hypothetical protein ACOCYQ_03525 [Alkalispirochaeta sp.]
MTRTQRGAIFWSTAVVFLSVAVTVPADDPRIGLSTAGFGYIRQGDYREIADRGFGGGIAVETPVAGSPWFRVYTVATVSRSDTPSDSTDMSEIALLAGPSAEFRLPGDRNPLSIGVESTYGVIFHRATGYWNAAIDGTTWFSSYTATVAGRFVFDVARHSSIILKPTVAVIADRIRINPDFSGTSAGAEVAYRFMF